MDDIIAIKVKDKKCGNVAFLTWGRIFDRLDTSAICRHVGRAAAQFGVAQIKSITVCDSLQEVAHYPYFFEALIRISWQPAPFGKAYKTWVTRKKAEIKAGKAVYFLGRSRKY